MLSAPATALALQADTKSSEKKRVIVVGAGICGLSTAWFLAARGHNVTTQQRAMEAIPNGHSLPMVHAQTRVYVRRPRAMDESAGPT